MKIPRTKEVGSVFIGFGSYVTVRYQAFCVSRDKAGRVPEKSYSELANFYASC